MGAKFPRKESSREQKLTRIFLPESERAGPFRCRERKFQGAKWPGSELARVLLADSLLPSVGYINSSNMVAYHQEMGRGCGHMNV